MLELRTFRVTMRPFDLAIGIAEQFGNSLAKGDFEGAHQLLTGDAKEKYSQASLKVSLVHMICYENALIQHVKVEETLEHWPAREENDVAWAYVGLSGDTFVEAVALILCNTPAGIRIRAIEWGRP